MRFITLVVRNIRRRPTRSGLTLIAVAIAVCAVVALVGISTGFKHSFMKFYESVGIDLLVVRSGSARRLTSTMDEGLGPKIEKLPGVKEVIPGLADVVSFPEENMYVVAVSGLEPETPPFEEFTVIEGRQLKKSDGKTVMLGVTLADSLSKKVGDIIDIVEGEPFEIVGIFDSFNVIQNGTMVVSIKELQRLMDRENQVSGFSIVTDDPSDTAALDRIAREVEKMESGITVRSTRDHVESLSEIQMAIAMAWLTSTVAILIGTVGMLNTMFMSIQERTLEIGLLRAVGWSQKRVISMILLEAVFLSLIGAVVGTLAAFGLVKLLTQMPMVNGLIEGRIGSDIVFMGILVAVLVGFVGGLLPAISASRLSPNEALRR